uniref:N-acetyltransferase domain-containing protein n=1 Tax=Macrostomum lignano TaxID=282301 RepID=A0A1I8FNK9_9PLAT
NTFQPIRSSNNAVRINSSPALQSGCRSQLQSRELMRAGASAAVALASDTESTAAPPAAKPARLHCHLRCGFQRQAAARQPAVLSDACGRFAAALWSRRCAMVESAARRPSPGQLLLLPGGLGRDADGFVVDLCVVGIAADAEHGGLAERVAAGAEPLEPWEARDDRRSVVRQAVTRAAGLGCRQVMLDSRHRAIWRRNADAAADVAEAAQSSALVYRRAPPKRPLVTDDADADETAPTLIGRIHGNSGNNSEAWELRLDARLSGGSSSGPHGTAGEFVARRAGSASRRLKRPPRWDPALRWRCTMKTGSASERWLILAACQLGLRSTGSVRALCENMPDGAAVKPGDVIDLAGGRVILSSHGRPSLTSHPGSHGWRLHRPPVSRILVRVDSIGCTSTWAGECKDSDGGGPRAAAGAPAVRK